MDKAKKEAALFIKKYKLTADSIKSRYILTEIAVKEGYQVYRYKDNDVVLASLNILQYAANNVAFTFNSENCKCIFVRSELSDGVVALLLLHELAHIRLGHMKSNHVSIKLDEQTADVFTEYVAKTIYFPHKIIRLLSCVFLIFGVMLSALINRPTDETMPVNNDMVYDSSTVFITQTGRKYHRYDCYHIKDREIYPINFNEAERLGYEKCKDCYNTNNSD